MTVSDDFLRCLEELDVAGARALWRQVQPNMPQPQTDHDALVALHHARTQSISVDFRKRSYSHRWLTDNGYPSGLPDDLRPRAERMYPKIVSAVGVCVAAVTQGSQPLAEAMQQAMSDAVSACYAEGRTDPDFVRARMAEARDRLLKSA